MMNRKFFLALGTAVLVAACGQSEQSAVDEPSATTGGVACPQPDTSRSSSQAMAVLR
jgi:hypothetical protein